MARSDHALSLFKCAAGARKKFVLMTANGNLILAQSAANTYSKLAAIMTATALAIQQSFANAQQCLGNRGDEPPRAI